jgi:hypothetical protein
MRSKVDIAIVGLIAAAAACGARSPIGYVARRRDPHRAAAHFVAKSPASVAGEHS